MNYVVTHHCIDLFAKINSSNVKEIFPPPSDKIYDQQKSPPFPKQSSYRILEKALRSSTPKAIITSHHPGFTSPYSHTRTHRTHIDLAH